MVRKAIISTIGIYLAVVSFNANSALIFVMDRVSDTIVHITATGTLDGAPPVGNDHLLSFNNPYDIEPPSNSNSSAFVSSSTMTIGSLPIIGAYTLGSDHGAATNGVPWLYFGTSFNSLISGSSVSGTLVLSLSAGTFALDGSTGTINWGFADDGVNAGTWVMGSAAVVPVPAAVWLFGSGLIGLIGVARRKKV